METMAGLNLSFLEGAIAPFEAQDVFSNPSDVNKGIVGSTVKLFGGKQPTPVNECWELCLRCGTEAKKGYLVQGRNSKDENNKIQLCLLWA